MRFLLPFLLALAPLLSTAQTLEGRITDAETGHALGGATVFVPGPQTGTASDADGHYRLAFERAGTYRVVFRFVGFQPITRTVTLGTGATVTLDLALTPTTLENQPITVTAKAQASDILSTPQAVAVVAGEDLERLRGASAFDALSETAGVRLLRTGPGIAKPMVRGLTSQRVLVIQNGIRQEGQQWGDEHAPELDGLDVARIEVVKGPASLLYGSDALGGVIQATSEPLFDYATPLAGRFTLQGMSNARLGATNLRLGGRQGAMVYEGSLSLKKSGSFETPGGVVPNTGLEELSGAVRLGRELRGGEAVVEYQRFGSDLGLFEPEEDFVDGADRFAIALPYQRVTHDRLRLGLDHRVGAHRLEIDAAWQQNQRKEFEEHHEEGEEEDHADEEEHEDGEEPALFLKLSTITVDARLHHRPIGRMYGTLGVSGFAQTNRTLGEETLVPGAETWNGAVYLTEEWLFERLTLSAGARYDHRRLAVDDNADLGVTAQTRTYDALSGALGLAWQPRDDLSLAFNLGRAFRAPVLIELFGNGVHEGTIRFERGDAALAPESSLSLDGTVRWLNRHVYLEATAFLNQIDDFIFAQQTNAVDPESGFLIYDFRQAQARLFGGEVRLDLHPHPHDWVHLHLAADYTRADNRDTGEPLPFTPPARVSLKAAIEQDALGAFEDFSFRLGPTFVARQTRTAPNELATDGYTTFDLSLSAKHTTGRVTLTPLLAVDNLFDASYLDHLSRFRPFGINAPGRNVRFQLSVRF